ncbi:MAG: type I glutamate--ammonia ligase [Anaerolineaceae bacterium]|nr:type I glutamate--ammonia ligase [Anaerolineaceae bacterium]
MFKGLNEALDFVSQHEIRMIDLKFVDLWGRWHRVTISAKAFNEELMEQGVGFDGSSVGLKSVDYGDMVLIPDLSTGFIDPFSDSKLLTFICNTHEAGTKKLFPMDPREIARRAERYLKETEIADQSIWGPELEFYIFDRVSFHSNPYGCGYQVHCLETNHNPDLNESAYFIKPHGGYHQIAPYDHFFNLRNEVSIMLEDVGVPVKYHHHEVGGAGQCEIETPMLPMMQSADSMMKIKYFVKNLSAMYGFTASFLPKPLYGEAGNGMHFHQHIFKNGKNVFYDPADPMLLSKTAYQYICGLLVHAPALLAFTNPSTNSYRRLVPGYEAPVNCFFSLGNRSAAVRIPEYATDPNAVRFEYRPPDATCNPYLAMAAMLMAGIDGIQREMDPEICKFGPINDDIFKWTDEQRKRIKSLPTSLGGALDALEADHDFLTAKGVFSEEMIYNWISKKRQEEIEVHNRPHPYEVEMYFDM